MDLSLQTIQDQLKTYLKEKNQIAVDTLRGLKTRITNEQISKGSELTSDEILALVKSEAKRRKEAVEAFTAGGRTDSAAKETAELDILSIFLPEQLSEEQIVAKIEEQISANGWTTADFGKAMGTLKQGFGNDADGAVVSRLLKERLK
ncbi:MAG TPA: GatB/YqeY domain-containing protein [Candidatus Doudnabacteria bacterium]|nr:GatB/YqeY domain-containing protein [Candidatus Doudnabacteria bacterium]